MHPLRTRAPTHGEHDTHARMGWTHLTPLNLALNAARPFPRVAAIEKWAKYKEDFHLRFQYTAKTTFNSVLWGLCVPVGVYFMVAKESVRLPPGGSGFPSPFPPSAPSHPISISISLFYPAGSEGEGERQEYQVLRLVTGLPPGSCVRAPSTSRLPGTEVCKRRKRQLV